MWVQWLRCSTSQLPILATLVLTRETSDHIYVLHRAYFRGNRAEKSPATSSANHRSKPTVTRFGGGSWKIRPRLFTIVWVSLLNYPLLVLLVMYPILVILCTYWLSGRDGRENIWGRVKYFPVWPNLTQSISILSYDHWAFPFFFLFFFFLFFFFLFRFFSFSSFG